MASTTTIRGTRMRTATITATGTTTMTEALYRLMAWLSPSYPTGAFSFSHGLEYAVESGVVRDRASLVDWVSHIIKHGAGWTDAVLFARAYEADDLAEIADYAVALKGSAELALEATHQGAAFLAVTRATWPNARLDALGERAVTLPIAFAAACVGNILLDQALVALLQSFAANLVSAGVRLIPLGQTDGQLAIAELMPTILATAERARAMPLDEMGAAAPAVDIASMRHETQHTRLFRS
jgi:urease accessory protein